MDQGEEAHCAVRHVVVQGACLLMTWRELPVFEVTGE